MQLMGRGQADRQIGLERLAGDELELAEAVGPRRRLQVGLPSAAPGQLPDVESPASFAEVLDGILGGDDVHAWTVTRGAPPLRDAVSRSRLARERSLDQPAEK